MKKTHLFFINVFISLLFFSCRSFRVIEVETYNPSVITFPSEVKSVMIVNNSAQQPDEVGHSLKSFSKTDSILSIAVDSTAYRFCMSLGKAMAESPIFSDVRICEDTLRMDSLFYNVRPFTASEVKSFCDDYGVDALISLDKLYFSTVFYETEMTNLVMGNAVSAEISGELRALWPGQKDVYTIPFTDSLAWFMDESMVFGDAIMTLSLPDVRLAMLYLADYTGQKLHGNFVPFWSEDKRWYYTNISSGWKQGAAYAAAGKWIEAAKIWEPLYESANRWKSKAYLASNLALCNEMTGNFEKAVEYAEISDALFKEHDGESDLVKMQDIYLGILKNRMEADRMLSRQLHE